MKVGAFVYIREGDESGSWGVVRRVDGPEEIHVALAGGTDVRIYERGELRKPRQPPEWWRP